MPTPRARIPLGWRSAAQAWELHTSVRALSVMRITATLNVVDLTSSVKTSIYIPDAAIAAATRTTAIVMKL
jgi:hypothetical protein